MCISSVYLPYMFYVYLLFGFCEYLLYRFYVYLPYLFFVYLLYRFCVYLLYIFFVYLMYLFCVYIMYLFFCTSYVCIRHPVRARRIRGGRLWSVLEAGVGVIVAERCLRKINQTIFNTTFKVLNVRFRSPRLKRNDSGVQNDFLLTVLIRIYTIHFNPFYIFFSPFGAAIKDIYWN